MPVKPLEQRVQLPRALRPALIRHELLKQRPENLHLHSTAKALRVHWWQSTRLANIELTATPARHASGRLSPNSDHTLWAGFAILGNQHRAWYSGDTSYHQDLANIGARFGPFDVTLSQRENTTPFGFAELTACRPRPCRPS
jgi:L-ascorbate metabolism protein UlaG (beta-lactamase superfamily)